MRNVMTSLAEVAGASSVTWGAFIWSPAAGLVSAGLFLLAFSRGASR